MTLQEDLKEIGFSESEAEVYITLLSIKSAQAGEISKRAQLNRTSTYQILDRMLKKGLITTIKKGSVNVFAATKPENLLQLQEEKINHTKKIVQQLEKLTSPQEEEVMIYKGRQGIRAIMNEVLKSRAYVSFGSSGQFLEIMGHDFVHFQQEKKKIKIKSRVLIGTSFRHQKIVNEAYAEFRFLEDKYIGPTTTWIFGESIALIIWSRIPTATVIKSKDLAETYFSYFEILWKSAKP